MAPKSTTRWRQGATLGGAREHPVVELESKEAPESIIRWRQRAVLEGAKEPRCFIEPGGAIKHRGPIELSGAIEQKIYNKSDTSKNLQTSPLQVKNYYLSPC